MMLLWHIKQAYRIYCCYITKHWDWAFGKRGIWKTRLSFRSAFSWLTTSNFPKTNLLLTEFSSKLGYSEATMCFLFTYVLYFKICSEFVPAWAPFPGAQVIYCTAKNTCGNTGDLGHPLQ